MNLSENVQRNGLIGGLAAVILFLVYYFIDPSLLFGVFSSFVPFLFIFPLFMTLSVIADKKENGGYLNITSAFKSTFFTGLLALFILNAFLFILQAVIDPNLGEIQKEVSYENAISLTEWIAGEEVDDEVRQEIRDNVDSTPSKPTLGLTLVGYLIFGAFGAIPAIIIALIVRKREDPLEKLKREQEILD